MKKAVYEIRRKLAANKELASQKVQDEVVEVPEEPVEPAV